MNDYDALLAAICDQPEEDTPRLALADWLEENDQPERAEFVRAQVELARTPPWEPFAVLCKWRRRDWFTGKPFRATLPPVDGKGVEWPEEAFRRGLGWRLHVRSLAAWKSAERNVLGRAPVSAMHLWSADTLDEWRRFATSSVVRNLREVHFVANPIEPLRALRESPAALGIPDLHFGRSSGAGMPFAIEDLIASPLGKAVRGLHFHMGYESLEELIAALQQAPAVERLSLATMGLTAEHIRQLHNGQILSGLRELDLRGNPLDGEGLRLVLDHLPAGIHTLSLAATGAGTGGGSHGYDSFNVLGEMSSLRRLDLSRNPLASRMARGLARSSQLRGLRSLDISKSRVGEQLRWLPRAKFWPNLVELDVRENPIPPAGVRHLLDAEVPAELTALVLTGDILNEASRDELRGKYGDRVVFVPSEVVEL